MTSQQTNTSNISTEESSSGEAKSSSASQEIPRIFSNMVHYGIHKNSPTVRILSQINLIRVTPSYVLKIQLMLSSSLRLGLSSGLFPSDFSTKTLYATLLSPTPATWPLPPISLFLFWWHG